MMKIKDLMMRGGKVTCTEVDPPLLVPTSAIHKALRLYREPKHRPKASSL